MQPHIDAEGRPGVDRGWRGLLTCSKYLGEAWLAGVIIVIESIPVPETMQDIVGHAPLWKASRRLPSGMDQEVEEMTWW